MTSRCGAEIDLLIFQSKLIIEENVIRKKYNFTWSIIPPKKGSSMDQCL